MSPEFKTPNNEHLSVQIIASSNEDPIKAAALLIFTKSTRLQMDGDSLADVIDRCKGDPEWMESQLQYMAKTIRSSWEFLDVTFSIRNVSRACAQQITRTRFTPIDGDLFGSYAMQSQRVTDMSKATWHNPIRDNSEQLDVNGANQASVFDYFVHQSMAGYKDLCEGHDRGSETWEGLKLEDARGALPINLHCSLVAKYNLRVLVDLCQARESYRAQGEYNQLAALMKEAVIDMWPWASIFFMPKDDIAKLAMDDLRESIKAAANANDVPGTALHDIMIKLAKVDDLLQGGK